MSSLSIDSMIFKLLYRIFPFFTRALLLFVFMGQSALAAPQPQMPREFVPDKSLNFLVFPKTLRLLSMAHFKKGMEFDAEISILDAPSEKILEEVNFRILEVKKRGNRSFHGRTGIFLEGILRARDETGFILIAPWKNVSLVILMRQESSLQDLEKNLSFPAEFEDIHGNAFLPFIEESFQRGFFKGFEKSGMMFFHPDAPITRAEFVTVLLRFLSITPEKNPSKPPLFSDVLKDRWYFDAIAEADKRKFVKGYPDGSFHPEHFVTLEEALIILLRAEKKTDDMLEFERRGMLIEQEGQYRFPFTYKLFDLSSPCTRACAAALFSELSFLKEHPDLILYGNIIRPEDLPYSFSGNYQIVDRDLATDFYEGRSGKLLFRLRIFPFTVEDWTKEEMAQKTIFRYLGEDRTHVFALSSDCERAACDQKTQEQEHTFINSFQIKNQDLFSVAGEGFTFLWHTADIPFKKKKSADKNLEIESPKKAFYISFERKNNFDGGTPSKTLLLGGRDWQLFETSTKPVNQTTFISPLSSNEFIVVNFMENESLRQSLFPKVMRALRTIKIP